ncbi:hypothetical protein AB0N16_25545 [Streptomyces sp. NPDC051105]|uniref:hypothetical protein n=1 Tax=Streptomyces sp. NPDC051105 TaxID=3154843 RepID=UPI003414A246
MIRAGQDVVAAEFDHRDEAAPGAAGAEVDLQGRDLHVPDVELDRADLGGALAVDLAVRPVLADRHEGDVGDDLVHDDVVAEGEVAHVGAGGRGEDRGDGQFAVGAGGRLLGGAQVHRADADPPRRAAGGGRVDVPGEVGADRLRPRRRDGLAADVVQVDAAGPREVGDRQLQPCGHRGPVHVQLHHRVRHRMRGGRRRPEQERRRYHDRDPGHQACQDGGQPVSRSGHEKENSFP